MQSGQINSRQHDGLSQLDSILNQFRRSAETSDFNCSWVIDDDGTRSLSLDLASRKGNKDEEGRKENEESNP